MHHTVRHTTYLKRRFHFDAERKKGAGIEREKTSLEALRYLTTLVKKRDFLFGCIFKNSERLFLTLVSSSLAMEKKPPPYSLISYCFVSRIKLS